MWLVGFVFRAIPRICSAKLYRTTPNHTLFYPIMVRFCTEMHFSPQCILLTIGAVSSMGRKVPDETVYRFLGNVLHHNNMRKFASKSLIVAIGESIFIYNFL